MAARRAVVASDLDAFRAVLADGRAGWLAPVGDAPALGDAVSRLLADPGARARLVLEAWERVQPYDWSAVAGEVVHVYEMVTRAGVTVFPDPAGTGGGGGAGGLLRGLRQRC
jgi:phosphatidylinositol alpha-mannosyltransferase